MKLDYNKNLESNLVKNGFNVEEKSTDSNFPRIFLSLRRFTFYIYPSTKTININYHIGCTNFPVKGCKTLNDLYRLEKLIEGTNEKKSTL